MPIDRTFILDSQEKAASMLAFVKANARPMAEAGKPLAVTVGEKKKKRSNPQNSRYWSLVTFIAENAWTAGKQYGKDTWHEYLAPKFGEMKEIELPDGSLKLVRVSTSDMDVELFGKMMTQIESYATQDLGLDLLYWGEK